jgi:hypothetical protein
MPANLTLITTTTGNQHAPRAAQERYDSLRKAAIRQGKFDHLISLQDRQCAARYPAENMSNPFTACERLPRASAALWGAVKTAMGYAHDARQNAFDQGEALALLTEAWGISAKPAAWGLRQLAASQASLTFCKHLDRCWQAEQEQFLALITGFSMQQRPAHQHARNIAEFVASVLERLCCVAERVGQGALAVEARPMIGEALALFNSELIEDLLTPGERRQWSRELDAGVLSDVQQERKRVDAVSAHFSNIARDRMAARAGSLSYTQV